MDKYEILQNLYIIFYKWKVFEIKTFMNSAESWLYCEKKGLKEIYYDVVGPFKNNMEVKEYLNKLI